MIGLNKLHRLKRPFLSAIEAFKRDREIRNTVNGNGVRFCSKTSTSFSELETSTDQLVE